MLKDALEFVGWELIGVISQAIVDDFEPDAFQECRKILKEIAEVRIIWSDCRIPGPLLMALNDCQGSPTVLKSMNNKV